VPLNALLFRPSYVVRLKEPFDGNGEFDAGTWIRRKKLLPNGHVEHTAKHPQFLVYGGWLYCPSIVIAIGGFGSDALTKAFPKEQFNIVSGYVEQSTSCKSTFQVQGRPQVGGMGFWFAYWRFRIVFQEKVRPLSEIQGFAFSDNIEDVSVSGLQSFSELLLCCLPVSDASRFFA